MGAPLRDALRRLCAEAGWSYAVFWRAICAQNSTHLVWGDGHCERTRGISGFEAMDLLLQEHGLVRNSCSDSITELLCQTEDRVGALVHKIMMHQVHALGDGIVGQAAVTGDHQWILREGFNDHGSISKGLAEMNEQFLAGIQTIAVIPFLPHGVVQLGSIQIVMEDIGFVKHVRRAFSHLGHVGALLTSVAQSSCSSLEKLHGKTQPTASEVSLIRQTITSTVMPLGHSVQPMNHPILNLNNQLDGGPVAAQVMVPNSGLRPVQQALRYGSIPEIEGQSSAMTSAFSSSGLHILEQQLPSISSSRSVHPTSFNESKLDVTKTIQLRSGCVFPCPLRDSRGTPLFGKDQSMSNGNGIARFSMFQGGAKESPSSTHPNLPITGASQLSKHMNHSNSCQVNQNDSHPSNFSSINSSQSMVNMVKHEEKNDLVKFVNSLSTKYDVHGSCYGSFSSSLQDCGLSNNTPKLLHNQDENFSHFLIQSTSENDLFDVVGLDIRKDRCHGTLDNMFPQKDGTTTHEFDTEISTSITHLDVGLVFDSVDYDVSGSGIFSEADPDQLLDAVVSNVSSGIKHSPDDSVSCRTSLTKISTSSLHGNTPVYGRVASSRQKQGEFLDLSPILLEKETTASTSVTTEDCSQKTGSKSQISLWVENGQNLKCDSMPAVHCKKVDEIGKLNRKRAQPGESPRPRPKDRQMIQDRVKELREIVPDGAKCSIDALLEKTIKHMLFLQSLTKHADKLKETGEPKIISKDGGLHLKDNFEGGVTWAFEVGTQSMICPIIVEDLNPPRQMLVEMLCEERGFFLEIADLIRGLGLTILKGVMEARKDKIWARFAVEANRDVTRVEIFLSLLHLLEPTAGSSLKLQGIDSIVMPHMFHQSSIPATGSSNYLQ